MRITNWIWMYFKMINNLVFVYDNSKTNATRHSMVTSMVHSAHVGDQLCGRPAARRLPAPELLRALAVCGGRGHIGQRTPAEGSGSSGRWRAPRDGVETLVLASGGWQQKSSLRELTENGAQSLFQL